MLAEIGDLKPSIGRTRRLMRRWSCSMRLLRYWLWRIRIGFKSASRAALPSMCRVAGNNGFPVGLASVDDDAIGTAMTLQRLSKEALGRRQIPMLAEMEFDRVADAVDGSVEIHPSSADLDGGFIDMPFSGDGALAPIEALQEQRREMNDPAVLRVGGHKH